jgi:hypothetical protein
VAASGTENEMGDAPQKVTEYTTSAWPHRLFPS